jgi:hypothetical protein
MGFTPSGLTGWVVVGVGVGFEQDMEDPEIIINIAASRQVVKIIVYYVLLLQIIFIFYWRHLDFRTYIHSLINRFQNMAGFHTITYGITLSNFVF